MTDKKLIVGNWKMNPSISGGIELLKKLKSSLSFYKDGSKIVICPPSLIIRDAISILSELNIGIGSQDCHFLENGPHTGDLSFKMFEEVGCKYSILGHSERRIAYCESDEIILKKIKALSKTSIIPILCVGENLNQRKEGNAQQTVINQLQGSIPEYLDLDELVIAYEPIWAIGTGKVPSIGEIGEIHHIIHKKIATINNIRKFKILYGGSVNPKNVANIFSIPNVDGALVGGSSLIIDDFLRIIEAS